MSNIAVRTISKLKRFAPDLRDYSKEKLIRDLLAGLTVGIVALPLSLALAIATGVPPIMGLYTAGIAGFLAAVFAGSAYSVSGPAAAMVPILSAVVQQHGLHNLPYITILAAFFLLFLALLGVGRLIRKVPESVVLGFTAGVAFVLFFGQLNSFFGLTGIVAHESFIGKLSQTLEQLHTMQFATLVIGALSIGIIILASRLPLIGKVPSTLISVVVATLLVSSVPAFSSVATLGSAYGALPLGFPDFNGFNFSISHLSDRNLWFPAMEIGALIAVESLLCAVVADKLTRTRHKPNQELMAQGFANIGSAIFGAMPATAVIARTGTIIKAGAATRVASLFHAVVVLAFVVALAPLAAKIPLPTLSAILIVTAYKIAELKELVHFIRVKSWRLGLVLAVTLVLTIVTDLIMGVSAGLLLHLAFALHHRLQGTSDQDGPLVLSEEEAR